MDTPIINQIIKYEAGELSLADTVDLFSRLRLAGMVSQLQGSYQRTFLRLVDDGLLSIDGRVLSHGEGDE